MGPPSPEHEFVEAIRAAPAEDAPRLVYADWLEENGDPDRAAFIRTQCELARWVPDWERRWQLESRQRHLRAHRSPRWSSHLKVAKDARYSRRGFLAVRAARPPGTVADWPAGGWVERARFTTRPAVPRKRTPAASF